MNLGLAIVDDSWSALFRFAIVCGGGGVEPSTWPKIVVLEGKAPIGPSKIDNCRATL